MSEDNIEYLNIVEKEKEDEYAMAHRIFMMLFEYKSKTKGVNWFTILTVLEVVRHLVGKMMDKKK